MTHTPKTASSPNPNDLMTSELLDCLKDPDCKNFVESELQSQGVSAPSGVGADWGSILGLVFSLLPQILDAVKKWRDQQNNPATATP